MYKLEIGGVFLYNEKSSEYWSYCMLDDLKGGHYFGNFQCKDNLTVRLAVF